MRWHDILFGTFLTVSIVDFSLAAPVPVQEKRHACVDAVHAPKDGMNVLEKRVDYWSDLMNVDDFAKLLEEHFGPELPKTPESSSSAPAAPLGPDHGSNLHMAGPPPNVESSTATNPADEDDFVRLLEEHFGSELPKTPESSSSAPLGPDHGSNLRVAGPAPNVESSTSTYPADGDDFVRLLEEHFGSELPKTPESSSSAPAAPLGPDHGSNLHVAGPPPDLESSTSTNPAPLMEPSSLSSTGPSMDYFAKKAKGSFKTGQEPVESSQVQPSPSPAPLWPNHVSMTDMQAPAPNTAASTTNPVPFMEPPSLSSTRPSPKSLAYMIDPAKPPDGSFKMGQKPIESSNAHVSSSAAPLPWPNYPPKLDVPALAPNLASPTLNPDPLMEPPSVLSTESQKADLGIYHYIKMAKLTGELPSVLSTESRKADLGGSYSHKMAMLMGSTKTSEYPVGSSGAYGWKSSAPLWPNHGSLADMQAAPNLASPTVNLAPLMEPPSELSTASRKADLGRFYGTRMGELTDSSMTSKYRSSGAFGWKRPAPSRPNYGSMTNMQAAPNLASSTVNPAPKPPSLPWQTFEPTPLGPPQPPRWTRKRPSPENPGMPTSVFDYDYPQER